MWITQLSFTKNSKPMEQTREVKLAYEIADILNDRKSIDWHIECARKFSETFLREKLSYVLSKQNIKNRAAYYNRLIQLHAKYSRD